MQLVKSCLNATAVVSVSGQLPHSGTGSHLQTGLAFEKSEDGFSLSRWIPGLPLFFWFPTANCFCERSKGRPQNGWVPFSTVPNRVPQNKHGRRVFVSTSAKRTLQETWQWGLLVVTLLFFAYVEALRSNFCYVGVSCFRGGDTKTRTTKIVPKTSCVSVVGLQ